MAQIAIRHIDISNKTAIRKRSIFGCRADLTGK